MKRVVSDDVVDQAILTLPPDEHGPIFVGMPGGSTEYITAERIAAVRADAYELAA